jgi:hypothetical protein
VGDYLEAGVRQGRDGELERHPLLHPGKGPGGGAVEGARRDSEGRGA